MEVEKLLTIVIPVYNVEKYIRQCMDSVIVPQNQMEQLEVIVVNDGTPDNSAKIAREYAEQYPDTIKVIDKENGGHGAAWNLGLKMATGKYVRFLDSDDWLSDLSGFITRLQTLDVDVVATSIIRYSDKTGLEESDCLTKIEFDKVFPIEDIPSDVVTNKSDIFNFHRCTYRTSMFQNAQPLFCERVYYDDSILYVAPMILGRTICIMERTLYVYRTSRDGQTMDESVEKAHVYDYVSVCRGIVDFLNRHTAITGNQRVQKDLIIQEYIKRPFRIMTLLPYREYKRVLMDWFPLIEGMGKIKLKPKMKVYKYTTPLVSWWAIRMFDKYLLKNRA